MLGAMPRAGETTQGHAAWLGIGAGAVLTGFGAIVANALASSPRTWVSLVGIALMVLGVLIMAISLVHQFRHIILRVRASEDIPQLSPLDFAVMGPELAANLGRELRVIQQARGEIVAAYKNKFLPEFERETSANRPDKLVRIQKMMQRLAVEMNKQSDRMDSAVPQVENGTAKVAESFRSMELYAQRRVHDRAGLRLLRRQIAEFLKFMKTEQRPRSDFQRFIKNLRGTTTIDVDAAGIRVTKINERLKSSFDGIRASLRRTLWGLYALICFRWIYLLMLRVLPR
jgi:hypothetical protein